jgi:hypothetical protein
VAFGRPIGQPRVSSIQRNRWDDNPHQTIGCRSLQTKCDARAANDLSAAVEKFLDLLPPPSDDQLYFLLFICQAKACNFKDIKFETMLKDISHKNVAS